MPMFNSIVSALRTSLKTFSLSLHQTASDDSDVLGANPRGTSHDYLSLRNSQIDFHQDVLAERDYYREVYVPDRHAVLYYHGHPPPDGATEYYFRHGKHEFPGEEGWSFASPRGCAAETVARGDDQKLCGSQPAGRNGWRYRGVAEEDLAPEEVAKGVVAETYAQPFPQPEPRNDRRRSLSWLSQSTGSVRNALSPQVSHLSHRN